MLGIVTLALVVPAHIYWVAPDNPFGYTNVEEYSNAFEFVSSRSTENLVWLDARLHGRSLLDVKLYHFGETSPRASTCGFATTARP